MNGFVVQQAGTSTGICPVCNTALTGKDPAELNAAMSRHWNFAHDVPTDEEAL